MERKAFGQNYFLNTRYPIIVYRVRTPEQANTSGPALDYSEKKHGHDFSELVIVTQGTGVHWVEGMEFNTVSGDVFLIQGMQQHYFKQRKDLVFFNIMFKPEVLPLPIDQFENIPGYHAIFYLEPAYRKKHHFNSHLHLDIAGLEMVSQIAWRMWSETKQRHPGMEAALLGDLIVLIVTLSRLYSASTQTPQSHALLRIANVIGKIEHAYSTNWTLAELAHMAGMSKANLHKAFKDTIGKSPIDYVIQVRLKHAKTLLSHSELSITEIAFQVGMNDSNYFSRSFKQAFGLTPSAYRKQLKQP